MPVRCLAATLAILLGCSSTDPSPTERERFEAAFALWQSQEIQSYHYEFRFVCGDCPPGWTNLRRIRVDEGIITQVADLVIADLIAIDDRSATIDRLFLDIRETLDASPYRFSAEYHPTLGYPLSVSVDLHRHMVDDEFGYVTQNLVSLH